LAGDMNAAELNLAEGLHPIRIYNTDMTFAAKDTVFMEDLNWLKIRDAIAAGKTIAILFTGGTEL